MQPRGRLPATPRQRDLLNLAADEEDQEEDQGDVDADQSQHHLVGRRDRTEADEDYEGHGCAHQRCDDGHHARQDRMPASLGGRGLLGDVALYHLGMCCHWRDATPNLTWPCCNVLWLFCNKRQRRGTTAGL